MTPADAGAWIDLIIARAPALREAGVSTITFEGGATLSLAPPPPPSLDLGPTRGEPIILDPMEDPATFGGVLPGYRIPSRTPTDLEDLP